MDLISPIVHRWINEAREDPDAFWARAAEQLPWLRPWERVFEWTPPTFRWFVGVSSQFFGERKTSHLVEAVLF